MGIEDRLIDALHRGREKYPNKIANRLFNGSGACALGAIAAGLGIPAHRHEADIYADIISKFDSFGVADSDDLVYHIWAVNDNCYEFDIGFITDPDEAVIEMLKSGIALEPVTE